MDSGAQRSSHGGDAPKAKVFISYSRKDSAFVDRLDTALKARGFEPLIDRAEIYAFRDWWQRIEALIAQADTIIFVLSPEAVASDICTKEIALAASLHKRLAPVVFKSVVDKSVPEPLRRLNFIFCDDDTRFEASMNRLAEALLTDIAWIRMHTEFGALAQRWSNAGRQRGLLLRSPALEEAERWVMARSNSAPSPSEMTLAYISESRTVAIADARRARRTRAFVVTLFVGIFAIVAGLTYAGLLRPSYLEVRIPALFEMLFSKRLSASAERSLKAKDIFKDCSICPEMVVVPAGEFMMGSPTGENDREDNEGPQHKVTIPAAFAVSRFEVTFIEWDACFELGGCKNRPADQGLERGRRPVSSVSWDDAQEYVNWLSKHTGKTYRLLSEAEWEYAARAGSSSAYFWGDAIGEGHANCYGCGNDGRFTQTAPVGSFAPNSFGLYDMHGNVWEWVQDCYQDNYTNTPTDGSAATDGQCERRVIRGGSWESGLRFLRSAYRDGYTIGLRRNGVGFRIARILTQ